VKAARLNLRWFVSYRRKAMSVREAGVKLKSIRAGNTRLGEHYTPQSPACMAGTGRAFICG